MSRIAGATLPAQKTRKDDHTYHPIVIEGTRHRRPPGALSQAPAPGALHFSTIVVVEGDRGIAGGPPSRLPPEGPEQDSGEEDQQPHDSQHTDGVENGRKVHGLSLSQAPPGRKRTAILPALAVKMSKFGFNRMPSNDNTRERSAPLPPRLGVA